MTQNNSEEPGRDLIKVLLAEGVISQAQADLAARDAENMSMGLDDVLLARRWVTEETLQRLAPWLFGGAGASGAGGVGSGSGGAGASGAGSGSGGAGASGSAAAAGASGSKSNGGAAGSTSVSDSNTGAAGAASAGTSGVSGSAGTAGSAGSGSGAGRTSGAGIGRASASGMKAADKDSQGAEAEGLKEMKGSSDDYGENLARYRSIVRQILGNEG